jgi:hypothetical protein
MPKSEGRYGNALAEMEAARKFEAAQVKRIMRVLEPLSEMQTDTVLGRVAAIVADSRADGIEDTSEVPRQRAGDADPRD